ncbi:hypothetical protein [Acinetobacter sp. FDAARGOS_131]|uniref:hypothetical protein n=1 Tax=Acinetobacter sp. FDAARGOS_131 TaxID=1876769 RepID=UPI0007351DE6|nr:hypothetical protein [Acinetobacter sp. FDAARGOS_131]PNN10542.1 hypothetical protein AL489_011570 [Acinetobacter sp. FDAARGOS_131]
MDKKTVKEIALANGFKLKEQPDGALELNPYVYVFADKLVEHQQAKVEELQKRMDAALKKLDKRRDELWSKWKEQADMQDQGAANAFEEAYWILEQALKGEGK